MYLQGKNLAITILDFVYSKIYLTFINYDKNDIIINIELSLTSAT